MGRRGTLEKLYIVLESPQSSALHLNAQQRRLPPVAPTAEREREANKQAS